MMYTRHLVLVPFILASALATAGQGATIDFESIASGTPVMDQFLSQGLRMESGGPGSGFVISKGTNDIPASMASSGTQVVLVGAGAEPLTLWFVDPHQPSRPRGVWEMEITFGFWAHNELAAVYRYLDVHGEEFVGGLIGSRDRLQFMTYRFNSVPEIEELAYGVRIANIGRHSVAIDDISFTLVPEPGSGGLTAGCLLVLTGGVCYRRLARPLQRIRSMTKLVLPVFALIALSSARPAQA